MRAAVWTAVLTVSAVKTRHACYGTADTLVTAILHLRAKYTPPRKKPQLDCSNGSRPGSSVSGHGEKDTCSLGIDAASPDVSAAGNTEADSNV